MQKNIALNRAAYASSSVDFNQTAHLATDGSSQCTEDFQSIWISKAGDREWIYVDLGAECVVSKIILDWGSRYGAEYIIQVSADEGRPINWKDVACIKNGKGGRDEIEIPETKARYVKMLGVRSEKGEGYSLWEFQIIGERPEDSKALAPSRSQKNEWLGLLNNGWRLQRASFVDAPWEVLSQPGYDDQWWIDATVPGTVLTSYLNIGAVPDPNYGDQLIQISESFFNSNFWYRNAFYAPEDWEGQRVWLNFDGINWKADIFLNGKKIGHIDGAFIRSRFDVTGRLMIGDMNCLAVLIYKNDNPGEADLKSFEGGAGPNGGILGRDNPTYHASIGWDWVSPIRGRNIGIWNDVYFDLTGDLSISDPFIVTESISPNFDSADLKLSTSITNHSEAEVNGILTGVINPGGIVFSHEVTLAGNETKTVVLDKTICRQLEIENPKLWWPNGYGEQNLYTLELELKANGKISDREKIVFGIRQMGYDVTDDILTIYVNGKRIFCRGGNWGMNESMLRCDKEGYDIRVRLHKEENFTMIRNWVGMTGDDEFYEACDKYGILVWDDFWLANPGDGPNPNDEEMFMNNVYDKIKRIRNHPCVALYCGRNEGNPPESLNEGMRKAVSELDGTRYYIPHSAAHLVSGWGPYGVRHPRWYFQNRTGPRIHSEIGLPNIPNVESIRAMMPEEFLWPINDMWGIHDFCKKSAQDAGRFIDMVNTSYGEATGVEDFCRKAQMVNMENHKAMFEAFAGGHGNGALMWMSQSAWPSMVWQTYDFYFEPTAGYFGCKKACEPLHILWDISTDKVKVCNNTLKDYFGLTATAVVYNLDGREAYRNSIKLNSLSDTVVECFTITYPSDLSATHFIKLVLAKEDTVLSDNFYWRGSKFDEETGFTDYTDLNKMNRVNLSVSASRQESEGVCTIDLEITNPGTDIALMIRLKALKDRSKERILPVYYEDNYFSLLPGESKKVRILFDSKYLGGEEPVIGLEGWNIKPKIMEIK